MLPQSVVLPLHVMVTVTAGALGSFGFTPGWQHTALIMTSALGQTVPLTQEKLVVKGVGMLGVTAATLAPCRTAFFREFFTYHALANSMPPRVIINNISNAIAVSISVCPALP